MSIETIVQACQAEWPQDKGDCSAFVRNVATRLGVTLTGDANSIVDEISGPNWQRLTDGVAASQAAEAGLLVIAGLRGGDQQVPSLHDHVVVVVGTPLAHDKYPSAHWGRLGGVGAENQTTNFAWRARDRDRVIYASIAPGV